MSGKSTISLRDRFDRHVTREAHLRGCWLWTGSKNNMGYGAFSAGGRACLAHRVSFELANSLIPEGMVVRHRCDTPLCVNPAHLELGTMKDNTRDMVSRGRARHGCVRGSANHAAKLREADVALIKFLLDAGVKNIRLGRLFGVSDSKIAQIKFGTSWGHVAELEMPEVRS